MMMIINNNNSNNNNNNNKTDKTTREALNSCDKWCMYYTIIIAIVIAVHKRGRFQGPEARATPRQAAGTSTARTEPVCSLGRANPALPVPGSRELGVRAAPGEKKRKSLFPLKVSKGDPSEGSQGCPFPAASARCSGLQLFLSLSPSEGLSSAMSGFL